MTERNPADSLDDGNIDSAAAPLSLHKSQRGGRLGSEKPGGEVENGFAIILRLFGVFPGWARCLLAQFGAWGCCRGAVVGFQSWGSDQLHGAKRIFKLRGKCCTIRGGFHTGWEMVQN